MTNENDKTMENILDAVFGEAASKAAADMGRELISTPPCAAREGSRRYRRKMEELTGSRGNASLPMRAAKAAACVAIAAAVGSTALVVGVEAIRKKVINYIFDRDHSSAEIYFNLPEDTNTYEGSFANLTYIPADFEYKHGFSTSESERWYFENAEGLWFDVYIPPTGGSYTVDTENGEINEIVINGNDAVFIKNPDYNILIWTDGKRHFQVIGNISKDEIIKISENIYLD